MMANIPGFLAPEMVGAFTIEESTIKTWSGVWYTTSAIYIIGAIVYGSFASAELQPWAQSNRNRIARPTEDDRQPLLQDT